MANQILLLVIVGVIIMASLTTTQAVDVTITYHVTRQPTYDVIKNVTSQVTCSNYESAKWTEGVCRCYMGHIFYVVNGKPGCYESQQIDSSMLSSVLLFLNFRYVFVLWLS